MNVTDSLPIASVFNNFFVSIGSQLAKDIVSDVNPLSYVTSNINSIAILDVTCDQYRNVISSLNNLRSGYDELLPFVAKCYVAGFIEPLHNYTVNELLIVGICPCEVKIAKVVPAFNSWILVYLQTIDQFLFSIS